MNKLTETVFQHVPYSHFTTDEVAALLPGSDDSRAALMKRAVAKGEIIHICRAFYCLAPKYQKKNINLYALAQRIYGPSYISLESALSLHGWIPEAVYTLTSVSFKKSKEVNTPLGLFTYKRVPQKMFFDNVLRHVDQAGNVYLAASPVKALADYVYVHKTDWAGLDPVTKSLRIERDEFDSVTKEEIDSLISNYNSSRVCNFLKALKEDLKL